MESNDDPQLRLAREFLQRLGLSRGEIWDVLMALPMDVADEDPFEGVARAPLESGYRRYREVCQAYAAARGFGFIDLDRIQIPQDLAHALPPDFMRTHRTIPLRRRRSSLWVAMPMPVSRRVVRATGEVTGCRIVPVVAETQEITDWIDRTVASPCRASLP